MITAANKNAAKLLLLTVSVGILAGLSSALFLYSLEVVNDLRAQHRWLLFTLPFSGLLIGWAYHRYSSNRRLNHGLILDEIHEPKKTLPFRMAPLVFASTLLTHLGGGSAGREGTAVQMGASLGDQLTLFVPVSPADRRSLLKAGMAAGFAAVIGAPFAGILFGLEVAPPFSFKAPEIFRCTLAVVVAWAITILVGARHLVLPQLHAIHYSLYLIAVLFGAGLSFGLAARFFVQLTHFVERILSRCASAWLHPVIGSVPLVLIFWLWRGSEPYAGLGFRAIQNAMAQPASWESPFLKAALTALTIGSGFRGGEFVPLVFIGTTLGSAIAGITGTSPLLLGALGFCAVFGAAANTPLACTALAIELFGLPISAAALCCCYLSYLVAGAHGIYPGQRNGEPKHILLSRSWPVRLSRPR